MGVPPLGSVQRKYVQRCSRPNMKPAELALELWCAEFCKLSDLTYPVIYVSPRAAPRFLWPSAVIFLIALSPKTSLAAFCSFSPDCPLPYWTICLYPLFHGWIHFVRNRDTWQRCHERNRRKRHTDLCDQRNLRFVGHSSIKAIRGWYFVHLIPLFHLVNSRLNTLADGSSICLHFLQGAPFASSTTAVNPKPIIETAQSFQKR